MSEIRKVHWSALKPGDRIVSYDNSITPVDGSSGFVIEREEPVPPLPTAPYTVIRVTWRGPHAEATGVRTLTGPMWVSVTGGNALSPRELAERITGFEVLSEPRATTAKAVLDRVDDMNRLGPDDMGTLREEFGVTDA